MGTFGSRLRALREGKGLKQADVAKACGGVAHTLVSKWERGELEPGHDALRAMADFFSVSTDYLLTGRNNMNTTPTAPEDAANKKPIPSVPSVGDGGDAMAETSDMIAAVNKALALLDKREETEQLRIKESAETERMRIQEVEKPREIARLQSELNVKQVLEMLPGAKATVPHPVVRAALDDAGGTRAVADDASKRAEKPA